MTIFQMIFNDIILLVLILGLLAYLIVIQRRLEMRMANIEAENDILRESKEGHEGEEEDLSNGSSRFKSGVDEKMNAITQELSELAEKVVAMSEGEGGALQGFESGEEDSKASRGKMTEAIGASQETIDEKFNENEQELRKVVEVLRTVTLEIKQMKNAIRERTIDFEL